MSLYEQATLGELRQILVNQWKEFKNFVPNDLDIEELENLFRFLVPLRNVIAHRVRDYKFSIEDFDRILEIREKMQPSNWRFE